MAWIQHQFFSFFIIIEKLLIIPKTKVDKKAQNQSFSHKQKLKLKKYINTVFQWQYQISCQGKDC